MDFIVFVNPHSRRTRDVYLLIILVLCAVSPARGQTPRDAASSHLKQAQRLSGQGDLNRAIASYDEAIKLKPGWAEAYLQRGYARRMNGALDEAINDFDKATALDARTTRNNRSVAEAYTNRGQIRRNRLEVENAITDFDRAIDIYGGDAQAYFDRGQARLLLEDFTGAIADFDSYLKNASSPFSRALAFGDRSLAKRLLGRHDEAHKDLQELRKLSKEERQSVMGHVHELELQLVLLRRLRAEEKKLIAWFGQMMQVAAVNR